MYGGVGLQGSGGRGLRFRGLGKRGLGVSGWLGDGWEFRVGGLGFRVSGFRVFWGFKFKGFGSFWGLVLCPGTPLSHFCEDFNFDPLGLSVKCEKYLPWFREATDLRLLSMRGYSMV